MSRASVSTLRLPRRLDTLLLVAAACLLLAGGLHAKTLPVAVASDADYYQHSSSSSNNKEETAASTAELSESQQRLRMLLSDLQAQALFSVATQCQSLCQLDLASAGRLCRCDAYSGAEAGPRPSKRSSNGHIDCNVLCLVGVGGRACNCNYAPFVGK